MILIHLWTFVLLFFHAHSFDTIPHGDYGAGIGAPHGPHVMMQQQNIKKNIAAALPNSAEKEKLRNISASNLGKSPEAPNNDPAANDGT